MCALGEVTAGGLQLLHFFRWIEDCGEARIRCWWISGGMWPWCEAGGGGGPPGGVLLRPPGGVTRAMAKCAACPGSPAPG